MAVPVLEGYATSTGKGTQLVHTAPSGISANELLFIITITEEPNNNGDVINTPSGWTKQGESGDANSDAHTALFTKVASGSEGNVTVTWTTSNMDCVGFYGRISGVDTTTPVDQYGEYVTSSSVSSHPITGVTTTVDDCLILYGLGFDGDDGAPFSVSGTGFTEEAEAATGSFGNGSSGCFGTRELATAGASGTATVTSSVSDGAAGFQVAIAPAAAGGLSIPIAAYHYNHSLRK